MVSGNFTLSLTDLSVPALGADLTFTRYYNGMSFRVGFWVRSGGTRGRPCSFAPPIRPPVRQRSTGATAASTSTP